MNRLNGLCGSEIRKGSPVGNRIFHFGACLVLWVLPVTAAENYTTTHDVGTFRSTTTRQFTTDDNGNTIATGARYALVTFGTVQAKVTNNSGASHAYTVEFVPQAPYQKGERIIDDPGDFSFGTVAHGASPELSDSSTSMQLHVDNVGGSAGSYASGSTLNHTVNMLVNLKRDGTVVQTRNVSFNYSGTIVYATGSVTNSVSYGSNVRVEFLDSPEVYEKEVDIAFTLQPGFPGSLDIYKVSVPFGLGIDAVSGTSTLLVSVPVDADGLEYEETIVVPSEIGRDIYLSTGTSVIVESGAGAVQAFSNGVRLAGPGGIDTAIQWLALMRCRQVEYERDVRVNAYNATDNEYELIAKDDNGKEVFRQSLKSGQGFANKDGTAGIGGGLNWQVDGGGADVELLKEPAGGIGGGVNRFDLLVKPTGSGSADVQTSTASVFGPNGSTSVEVVSGSVGGSSFNLSFESTADFDPDGGGGAYSSDAETVGDIDKALGGLAAGLGSPTGDDPGLAEALTDVGESLQAMGDTVTDMTEGSAGFAGAPLPSDHYTGLSSAAEWLIPLPVVLGVDMPDIEIDLTQDWIAKCRGMVYVGLCICWILWVYRMLVI